VKQTAARPEPIWKIDHGRFSPCRVALEQLQPLFAESAHGREAWERLFDEVNAFRHARLIYRTPGLSRERAILRKLRERIATLSTLLGNVEPYTASLLAYHYGNVAQVRAKRADSKFAAIDRLPELDGVLQGLEDLRTAVQAALDHSLDRGDGTAADVGAHTLARRVWEILSEACVTSSAEKDSPFAQILDVALPIIGSRVTTQTVLSAFPRGAVTFAPTSPLPRIPTLAELAMPNNDKKSRRAARVKKRRRP